VNPLVDDGRRSRGELVESLSAQRSEIEAAMLARVRALSEPPGRNAAEYAAGQRAAVEAGVAFGLNAIGDEDWARGGTIPEAVLLQARLAARSGIGLDIVLRRYFACYAMLGDFIVASAEYDVSAPQAKFLLRALAPAVDRLIAGVAEAYEAESARMRAGVARRRTECVERLLAGERIDARSIPYDFDRHHIALFIESGARALIATVATKLGCELLFVSAGEDIGWAWLGSRKAIDVAEVLRLSAEDLPEDRHLAVGEPSTGIAGWRQSHRQAEAVWPIAQRRPGRISRYRDDGLLAAAISDDLLALSLPDLFLEPLGPDSEHGRALLDTLRAYLATERNLSSAGAMLGVSRRTVANRLRTAEAKLGSPLSTSMAEIDLALRVRDLKS
jgi:hypothetical protein